MAETAADLVDNLLPRVPVRQWVLSFPIPLRSLFAIHPYSPPCCASSTAPYIATSFNKQASNAKMPPLVQ